MKRTNPCLSLIMKFAPKLEITSLLNSLKLNCISVKSVSNSQRIKKEQNLGEYLHGIINLIGEDLGIFSG